MRPDRRTFLKWSAVAATAVGAGCRPDEGSGAGAAQRAAPAGQATPLPRGPLRAAADAALPDELGPDGKERVVAAFESWLDGFTPVNEQVHGYGSQEITFGPADPRPRWLAQLEALDLEADARHGRSFADLEIDARRELLETALAGESGGIASRPAALETGHVIAGLLGFFLGSSEAQDLAYGRRIGAFECRPLETSGAAPRPIGAETASAGPPGGETALAEGRVPPRPRPPSRRGPRGPDPRVEPGLEPGS